MAHGEPPTSRFVITTTDNTTDNTSDVSWGQSDAPQNTYIRDPLYPYQPYQPVWPFRPPTVHFQMPYVCPVCVGRGKKPGRFYDEDAPKDEQVACQSCFGSGVLWR